MRTALLLFTAIVIMQTNSNSQSVIEMESDMVDIALFVDSLLTQKNVVFFNEKIEARQVWLWSKKWGARPKVPHSIEFGNKQYKLKNAKVIFGHNDLKEGLYDIDSAMKFSFKGKEFYLAWGGYHNCNGSGCGYVVYFLLDKQKQRLHIFEMFRQPASRFLGDIDNDGQLDIVIQDYLMTPGYEEKNSVLALYPYTQNEKGHFVRMKSFDNVGCFLVGACDAQWYPKKFRIVGYNCLSLEIKQD